MPTKRITIWAAAWVMLVAFDQLVKYVAVRSGIKLFFNDRFAFSLPLPASLMYIIYAVVIIAILRHVYINFAHFDRTESLAWIMILAGSLSNIGERLLLGYVRDFIPVFTGIFNIADFYIIIGILGLLVRQFFYPQPGKF